MTSSGRNGQGEEGGGRKCIFYYVMLLWNNKQWKILKEMGILDHLTSFLRNLYAGQVAAVRTRRGIMNWFEIGKGVCQGCVLSPCLFNLYAEYITWNARLVETEAEIKIARKYINNLRYADETALIAESEELKSLLMKVREWKAALKLNIQKKNKRSCIQFHHFMANRWGNNRNSDKLYFLGLQN